MTTIKTCLLVTTLLLSLCSMSADSAELTIKVTSVRSITNPLNSNQNNVLLNFELPAELDGADIHDAELILKPQFSSTARRFTDILVYPLAQSVSFGRAAWTDIYTNFEATVDVANGTHEILDTNDAGLVRINITYWIDEYSRSNVSNLGFLLTPGSESDENLSLSTDATFGGNAMVIVKIVYVPGQ